MIPSQNIPNSVSNFDRSTRPQRAGLARVLIASIPCLFLTACVNLTAVSDFALQAGTLSGYKGVSDDLVGTKQRLYVYAQKDPGKDGLSEETMEQRAFEQRQQVLVNYMKALSALADGNVPSFDTQIAQAGDGLKSLKLMDAKEEGISVAAADLLVRIATDYARERKIHDLVVSDDPAVQDLIFRMNTVVRGYYLRSLDSEKLGIDEFVREAKSENSAGLSRLTDLVMLDHYQMIESQRKAADAYAKALDKIARAHADLAHNIDVPSSKDAIAKLKSYSDDLKSLYSQLKH
jgi:hypothetical protein